MGFRKAEGAALALRVVLVSAAIVFELTSYLTALGNYNECINALDAGDRCLDNRGFALTDCAAAKLAKDASCTPNEAPITHPCFNDFAQASVECSDEELNMLISDFSGWPSACQSGLGRLSLCTAIKPSINVLIVLALLGGEAYISLGTEAYEFRAAGKKNYELAAAKV